MGRVVLNMGPLGPNPKQEMGNIILDAINMGKNSENSMAAREYMRQGMTEEEAKRQVWKDNAVEILWAGYGGAISAGAMAGFGQVANDTVAKVRNTVGNYAVGDTLTKNGRYVDLQEQANALQNQKKGAKLAKKAQEVAHNASVGDVSPGNKYRMGKVATQIAQQAGREASRAEVAEFRAAAEKYLAGQRDIQHKKLDLNAGDNGQGTVAYALAHETTHFIKDWSATKYQTYADILIEAAESKGISYDSLLDRQLARLSELRENRSLTAEELQELAYDETIAEMSETILTDTDAAQRVSQELYKQDRTLWEKIKDFFTGLVEKLRNAYKGVDPDSDIGRVMKRAIQDNETVAQAWAEAVVEAGENYQLQDGQKNNARAGEKFSLRTTTDGKAVAVVDEDILSGIDLTQWNDATKKAVKAAAKEALKSFEDGIVVDGVTRKVNKTTRKEYTGSNYSEKLAKKLPTLYVDKMRAAGALDDIVIATTDWARDGKLVHPRTDNFVDFDHGNVLIETDGHQYSAEVVVGITDKGEAVFYDVVDIQPASFTLEKQEPSTNVTTNESPDAVHEGSLVDSIRKSSRNVNSVSGNQTETENFKKWFGD